MFLFKFSYYYPPHYSEQLQYSIKIYDQNSSVRVFSPVAFPKHPISSRSQFYKKPFANKAKIALFVAKEVTSTNAITSQRPHWPASNRIFFSGKGERVKIKYGLIAMNSRARADSSILHTNFEKALRNNVIVFHY